MSAWRFLPEGTEQLADDETALWQGRPTTSGLARRFLHIRAVTGYFLVLAIWNLFAAHSDGMRASDAMVAAFWVAIPAIGAAAIIYAVAWIFAMTTHYMITNKRIIMQIGTALPIMLSLPLHKIGAAGMNLQGDGSGDITVAFNADDQLAYLLLWPHARPWRFKRAEPMLRSIREARTVAAILANALVAASTAPSVAPALVDSGNRHHEPAAPVMVVA
jgi:hypothetical protein